jgi:hypothetical protein
MSDQGVEESTVGTDHATDRPQTDIEVTPAAPDLTGVVNFFADAFFLNIVTENARDRSAD